VGLVQREIEASGISTVSLSMIPAFTAKVGVPRLAGIAYPMSRPMGRPGDAAGQRAVLSATLDVLRTARAPGTFVELPFVWPESVAEARRCEELPPPIAQLLKRKPWLLPRLYAGDLPRGGR
jgi:D-proline reductase (dithiol) PrdB